MVFNYSISGLVFKWSAKLDCFIEKKNIL
jgi:hypothetical protein